VNSDCRNDCLDPSQFPRTIDNRPGLPHVGYRIGTYSDFLQAILRGLNKSDVLQSWTHREPDDPGIALLEGASVLGDILTFYQELYANEAYLRTAQWRESVADLVRLLGYRLSPGVGGNATFAFEVRGNKRVVIPAGFPIKAQVEGLKQPAEFETIGELEALPTLNKFHLYQPFAHPPVTPGAAKFSVETSVLRQMGLELNEGDRLMLVTTPTNPGTQRQIVVVAETRERFEHTEITIEGSWQGGGAENEIAAYKIGRSFKYFGYNAPPTTITVVNGNAAQGDVDFSVQVGSPWAIFRTQASVRAAANLEAASIGADQFAEDVASGLVASVRAYNPLPNRKSFPLDQEIEDISLGSTMLVSLQLGASKGGTGATYFFDRTVVKVSSASLTLGAMTGGASVVEFDSEVALTGSTPPLIYTDIRTVEFHEVIGEQFGLNAPRAAVAPADDTRFFYYGDAHSHQALDGRPIQLVRDGRVEQFFVSVEGSVAGSDGASTLRPLTLNPGLQVSGAFGIEDFPLDDPSVTVYGNLVSASQGTTEREATLGNGDSRRTFQTFRLPKAPLTYHNSVGEVPPEVPELRIYADDRLWQRVPTFFDREPGEQIYIVREDANGDSWVQFGDGETGKRLPSGVGNVVAKYRTGIGAYGSLKEGTTAQAGGKLDRLDKVQLPGVASGGSEPETGENAREAAPGRIQSLDRLVSLKDFESETLAIPGVSKVSAGWSLQDNVPTVELTVLMESGREGEFEQIREIMADYNRCRGPQRFSVKVEQGMLEYVCVRADVAFAPTYREEVVQRDIMEALGLAESSRGLFALADRRFGQAEYSTRISGAIQNVEGVLWTRVTGLASLGETEGSPNPCALNPVIPCDGRHVLGLPAGGLRLSRVSTPSAEVC
jgi:hypothetical protein